MPLNFTRLWTALKNMLPALQARRINWTSVRDNGDALFQAAWRLGLLLLLVGLLIFIFRGLRDDGYAIAAFQAPDAFEAAGFDGPVLSKRMIDKLQTINQFISSQKADLLAGIQTNVDRPDLDVEVMGIGLTLNSVTYHLRELLGRKNRTIGGELTDLDQTLSFTLRMTGFAPKTFSYVYQNEQRHHALESLLDSAAMQIIRNLDPYRAAVYYYKKEENDKSLEVISEIVVNRPDEAAWGYLAWGNLLNKEEDSERAVEKFRRATRLDPELEMAWTNWAWTEFQRGNFTEALPLFERLTKLKPQLGGYWSSVALCNRRLGRYEEADQAFAKAVKIEPGVHWWYGNWADLKFERKDTAGIRQIYQMMRKNVKTQDADYHLTQATMNVYLGQPQEALAELDRVLELDPDHSGALSRKVQFLHRMGKEHAEVIALSKRLLKMADRQQEMPPNLFRQRSYNHIAMAEYGMERYDSAMVYVKLAIAEDSTAAYPYTTLAEIHGLQGQDDGFYAALETALTRVKGFPAVNDLLQQEPYRSYAGQERFKRLLQAYEAKKETLQEEIN